MKSELKVLGNEFVHNRHSHPSHSADSISEVPFAIIPSRDVALKSNYASNVA